MPPIRLVLLPLFVVALAWAAQALRAEPTPPVPSAGPTGTGPISATGVLGEEGVPDALVGDGAAILAFDRHLDADAALAAELVALGEAKSRNLVAITGQQRRMGALLDETDAFLATTALPAEAAPAVATYREGAASVRAAMADAQAGFVRFDWERVRGATAELTAGEAALRRAAALVGE